MNFHLHHSAFILSGFLLSAILVLSWKRRNLSSGRYFVLLITLALLWNIAFFLELVLPDPAMKILMVQFQFIGICFLPLAWFAFIASYTGFPVAKPFWILFVASPVLTNILIWLVPRPNWFWGNPTLVSGELFPVLEYNYGFWFYYVNVPISYGIFLLTIALLVRAYYKKPAVYRFQIVTLLAALALPLLTDLLYVTGNSPVAGVNYSAATFSLSALIVAWSLYRYKFLDLLPMAHEIVFEKMEEGILILDIAGRIVDANPAAMRLLGIQKGNIGQPLAMEYAHPGHQCLQTMKTHEQKTGSFSVPSESEGREDRYFECSAVEIHDIGGEHLVTVFSIRENTQQMVLFNQVQQQSIQDDLTGVFNRRYFFQKGEMILQRSLWPNSEPLSLLAVDIDNLKPINDHYGHRTGDNVLKEFCETAVEELRPLDILCRMGGDEFAVLLPDTGITDAVSVARRILEAVSLINVKSPRDAVPVSVSIGLASTDAYSTNVSLTIEELLHTADTHMYEAKKKGGNQLVHQNDYAAGTSAL